MAFLVGLLQAGHDWAGGVLFFSPEIAFLAFRWFEEEHTGPTEERRDGMFEGTPLVKASDTHNRGKEER